MEDQIEKLIKEYIRVCHKKDHYSVPASTKEDHKNYKYFDKIIQMYGRVPEFDIYTFIEANLEDKIRFPAQIATKTAFKRFQDYKAKMNADKRGKGDEFEILVKGFENTVDIIKDKMGSYDPDTFFNKKDAFNPLGISMFHKKSISQFYCVMSKAFWERLKIQDEDMAQMFDWDLLKKKRDRILSLDSKKRTKLKSIVGEKYWI